MKKEQENPNNHMGKKTGYTLIDGVYHIAPVYQEQFDFITHKKVGIDQMLAMVTMHAAQDLTELTKQSEAIWKVLADDIGLPKDKIWQYLNGVVSEKK